MFVSLWIRNGCKIVVFFLRREEEEEMEFIWEVEFMFGNVKVCLDIFFRFLFVREFGKVIIFFEYYCC